MSRRAPEAKAAARPDHRNIVPIDEVGAYEGQHYAGSAGKPKR